MSNKLNLKIKQGTTFIRALRWETSPLVWKNISTISNAAPCTISCIGHGLREGQLFGVQSSKGMTELNTTKLDYRASVLTNDSIAINSVNSLDYKIHTASSGVIVYRTIKDLTGYTARMTIRDKVGGISLYELSTTLGNIIIDTVSGYITIKIPAADTTLWTWAFGIYDLELESSDGIVDELLQGNITVQKEVTT